MADAKSEEDKPLDAAMPPVDEYGAEVLPVSQPEEAEDEGMDYDVGDEVVVLGGQLNKTVGKLYGYFPDRFIIQPRGATDRVIRIDIIDGELDPDLGIDDLPIIKKTARRGFLSLVDMRAGQFVETFDSSSKSAGIYKVIKIDEAADSALLEDQAGTQTLIEFNFMGIPPDLPFTVIRTREAPVPEEGAERSAQAAPVSRVAVDEEDVLEQGQAPNASEDAEGEDAAATATAPATAPAAQVNFEILDEIELAVEEELKEIGSSQRVYNDIFQRREMLSEIIRLLPVNQRRDAAKLQEIRRMVETMIILRNDVVKYGVTGDPTGVKTTSLGTLAELIQRPDVTLSRKIADVNKVLYIDHSLGHQKRERDGERGDDPSPGKIDEGLSIDYLLDVIRKADSLQAAADAGTGEGQPGVGMPKFILDMDRYRQQIQTPYQFAAGTAPVEKDEEVFRGEIPSIDQPNVNALETAGFINDKGRREAIPLLNPPIISQVPFSVVRALRGRTQRFLQGEKLRVVEPAETPSYTNVLVFPLSTSRDLGPIRTGLLAHDMSLGSMQPKMMLDILEELGEITDFPTAEGILSLGVKGNIMGNVMIKDWLASLNFPIHGLGDAWQRLRGYGAQTIEWSVDQAAVLQEKIESNLAGLRLFMIKQREENNALLANLKFVSQGLLSDEDSARLLARVESEPLLQKVLTDVREYMGDLAKTDINWLSFIFIKYPDLLLSVLGQQGHFIARERLRHVRDLFIQATMNGYRLKKTIQDSGKEPVQNTCKHVKHIHDIRMITKQTEDEPRDVTRIKLLIKLLNDFRGKTEEDWIWCKVCNQHLVCAHELLQIQEFLRPAEKATLHKELLIVFSGGQFSGKFVCRVCGQGIADLEFDQSMEFDDEGRPMMGRSVMVDRDAVELDELEELLKGPADIVEEVNFGSDSMNEMYKVFKRISSGLGIDPEEGDYKNMVFMLSNYISSLPTRDAYADAAKGKKTQDYDVFYSIRYITAAAAILLLNIQTRTPDYVVYYTSADCKDGFLGYPLEGEENLSGINCVASIIAGINDKEFPWNMTTLQRKDNLVARKDAIFPFIKGQVDTFSKDPTQMTLLQRKREYRTKLFGKVGGLVADQINKSFRPVPYMITVEDAAKDAGMPEAASPEKQAVAWIRTAHGIARETSALNPDTPISETTCCLHSIKIPQQFWADKKMPTLEPRQLKIGEKRSAIIASTFYTEMPATLEGKVDPKDYYKLFAQLCYTGDNIGLPHKLGLTNTCTECGLNFKMNPKLVFSGETNPKRSKEEESKAAAELQSHIVSQGVVINEDTIDELLTIAHQKMHVEKDVYPEIPRPAAAFAELANTAPEPLESWKNILSVTQVALTELGDGATKIQIAKAAETLVAAISEKEAFIRARLGDDVYRYIESFTKRTPRECGESLTTYILVPFQRWLSGVNVSGFKMLKSYELSRQTEDDIIKKGLGDHLKILADDAELKGLLKRKVRRFVEDLAAACKNIFPNIRPILIPGGSMMVGYLVRAYVMGIVQRFLDPHHIPEGEEDLEEGGGAVNIRMLYKALAEAVKKYAIGSRVPSEADIRLSLEKRSEKEKQQIIGEMSEMTRDRRQVELTQKKLGMGRWAVGGTKAIRQYDPERYEAERLERANAGIVDYAGAEAANAAEAAGRPVDMFGMDFGGEYDEGGQRLDGDYTDGAMREDEY